MFCNPLSGEGGRSESQAYTRPGAAAPCAPLLPLYPRQRRAGLSHTLSCTHSRSLALSPPAPPSPSLFRSLTHTLFLHTHTHYRPTQPLQPVHQPQRRAGPARLLASFRPQSP